MSSAAPAAPSTGRDVHIREIPHGGSMKEFIELSWKVNAGDPHWVPPLRLALEPVLDRKKHPFHQHADVAYFLAERGGETVGRIAAVVNHQYNQFHEGDRTGFFGFFESTDDAGVAAALLDAAEELVQHSGVEGLSVRAVAGHADTTVRAVYAVYGSKAGLLAALGERTFDILGAGVAALPVTDDPGADLIEAAVSVFRRFALEHPSLFRLGVQQVATPSEVIQRFRPSAQTAFVELERRITRLGVASVGDAALAFHALCEGMAAVELRCMMNPGSAERQWRDAFTALVAGLARQGNRVP